MLKVFYDRELAISEHNVKLSNILHNSSLIMGRQIINILPEGYGPKQRPCWVLSQTNLDLAPPSSIPKVLRFVWEATVRRCYSLLTSTRRPQLKSS